MPHEAYNSIHTAEENLLLSLHFQPIQTPLVSEVTDFPEQRLGSG